MRFAYDYSEQRQHINLSNQAYEILSEDIGIFTQRIKTISGYINLILKTYIEESDASVSLALERQREQYSGIISRQKEEAHSNELLTPQELQVVEYLLSDYSKELKKRISSYPKEKALKIRLQNDVYSIFYPNMPESDHYEIAGDYIKAILEDFARRPRSFREQIICSDIYAILSAKTNSTDLSHRSLLRISYTTFSGSEAKKFRIKPYALMTDPESQFHYLVGLSKPYESDSSNYSPAVFRLSRIQYVREDRSFGSGRITKEEEKNLERILHTKGVRFLYADENDFIVKLTPSGKNKYNNILHMRPIADSKLTSTDANGNTLLHFHCTSIQIYNYFFKFGADATIISPKDLFERFKQEYTAAVKNYDKSPNT